MGFNDINIKVSGGSDIISTLQTYTTKILKPNIVDGKNVLTQEMLSSKNTKYVIKYNYELLDATITMPQNVILEFDGGSIKNGTLVGNDTLMLNTNETESVLDNVTLDGTWKESSYDLVEEVVADKAPGDGMGKIILRKDKTFKEQLTQENTIYVIRYDFELTEDVTIPANCVLEFEGGSIGGEHTLNGTNTGIEAGLVKIFSTDVTLDGNWKMNNRNYISYKMFGAKLNGVDNDYKAIKACHDFANINRFDVVEREGIINIVGNPSEDKIIVKTNTDISGCTFLIKDGLYNQSCYLIADDNDFIDYTNILKSNKEQFAIGSSSIACLNDKKGTFFVINGTRILGSRPYGDGHSVLNYYNNEPFTILSDGVIDGAPLYCDYTEDPDSASSTPDDPRTFTVNIALKGKSIYTNPITFKAPDIVYDKNNDNAPYPSDLFMIERNNSTLVLPSHIDRSGFPTTHSGTESLLCLFNCQQAYNIKVVGGICENAGYIIGQNMDISNYIVRFTDCSNITIENVVLFRGWGAMNTEFVRNVTVKDSVLNRFDNHFGIGNLYMENCRVIGSNNFCNLGYGNGIASFNNCTYYAEKTSKRNETAFIAFRMDLRLTFSGDVFVNNCYVKSDFNPNSTSAPMFNIVALADKLSPTYASHTYFTKNTVKSINIDGLVFDNNSNYKNVCVLYFAKEPISLPINIGSINLNNIECDYEGEILSYYGSIAQDTPNIVDRLHISNCNLNNLVGFSVNGTLRSRFSESPRCFNNIEIISSNLENTDAIIYLLSSIGQFSAVDSRLYMRNIYNAESVIFISLINCVLKWYDITGGNIAQLKPDKYSLVNCKFTAKDSNQVYFLVGSDLSEIGNGKIINCMLDSTLAFRNNDVYTQYALSFLGYKTNDYGIVGGTAIPINNICGYSDYRKSICASYDAKWYEYDGVLAGTKRNGTFAQKPTASDIYVGFRYFCTDKQTTEGATDGIEIIHKGNNVWVDALGRVVS